MDGMQVEEGKKRQSAIETIFIFAAWIYYEDKHDPMLYFEALVMRFG